jgi:hypothetical protein
MYRGLSYAKDFCLVVQVFCSRQDSYDTAGVHSYAKPFSQSGLARRNVGGKRSCTMCR